MSKDRKKVLHIHSSVNDKQPTSSTLEFGELGVNNATGNAFISTKNSDGQVVRFSEDDTIIDWMEMKEVFPYEGYVRGGSGATKNQVLESDLLNNKSNIIIKINQVAANNSPYNDKINEAKDIYDVPINPISEDGYKDGSGIAIDMSRYAMIGANPSFSSVTTTCHATLKGTTEILGTEGDCGSNFNVNVSGICIQADDVLNIRGNNESNFGTSCDGQYISDKTTLKGNTVEIKGCQGISAKTNNFELIECNEGGSVKVDTTNIDIFGNETNIESCGGISAKTSNLVVTKCDNTDGSVKIDTTNVNVSANTTNVKSCGIVKTETNDFEVVECTDGSGNVKVDTTNVNVSANTTIVESCGKIELKSDDINITQCTNGNGKVAIKACSGITLESDNLVLKDCSGNGKMTITTDDLCLAGEQKANLYGNETNVGLDCDCSDGAVIATDTRVFGKAAIVTTKADCSAKAVSGNVETYADGDIKETADGNIVEIASGGNIDNTAKTNVNTVAVNGNINETASNGNISETAININNTASNDINNVASNDINNTASNDICSQAASSATFYGAVDTNIGINCNDTATAATTSVKGGVVIIDASTTNVGISAKSDIVESAEGDIVITSNDNICENAGDIAAFYGANETKIGVNCNGDITSTLTIGGNDTCIEAEERATLYGAEYSDLGISCDESYVAEVTRVSGATINIGGDDINITANNNLCEKAKEAYFYGSDRTEIGKGCDGVSSSTIVYYRNPEAVCDNDVRGLSSTTIDGALHEVYDRSIVTVTSTGGTSGTDVPVPESGTSIVRSGSTTYTIHQDADGCNNTYNFTVDKTIVSMSAYTPGGESEVLKEYTLWQYVGDDRVEIGKINIPKDHILKDVAIKHGHYDKATSAFTECEDYEPKSGCTYYIKMVWNVYDPESGHGFDDKVVYLPADDFIQDINSDNSYTGRGVTVDVWYDGNGNRVSADTMLNFETPSDTNDFMYSKHNGEHWESGTTIIFNSGDVSGFAQAKYKPWSASTEINIPTCVSHLNRHKITFQSGDVSTFVEQTYDPGKDCANTAETINIPTSLKHLAEFNGNCYVLENDICMTGNTIVAQGFYSKSDVRLKENINYLTYDDYKKADAIDFKRFNFVDDETKTKTYGVIAQEVLAAGLNEIVHKDSDDTLNVDYISLLILKIANLERKVRELSEEVQTLKNK